MMAVMAFMGGVGCWDASQGPRRGQMTMITRRKLFGLLAGLPFVKALPVDASDVAWAPVIGEVSAGIDYAVDSDYSQAWNADGSKTITISWEPVAGASYYRIFRQPGSRPIVTAHLE